MNQTQFMALLTSFVLFVMFTHLFIICDIDQRIDKLETQQQLQRSARQ